MDASQMVRAHIESGAGVTVAGIRVPREEATAFGVIETAEDGVTIHDFLEKPADPPGLADAPDQTFASMGNYVFTADVLVDALERDAKDQSSRHDMGGDIIPMLVDDGKAAVYDFKDNAVPGCTERDRDYWRDVGTLDSYHEAHVDLVSALPVFNLYNDRWPIFTSNNQLPGAKFVAGASVRDTVVAAGSIVSGASVDASVLGLNVHIQDAASVQRSVLLDNVRIGRGAVVRNVIADKNVVIADNALVGVDHDEDRRRGLTVSDGGVTVIGKGVRIG
jgi:glucose-1-phosphate adenylyltransferase